MIEPSPKENVVEFTGQTSRPAPLTPAECDLRDFPSMFLDIHRLLTSESWIEASASPHLSHALVSLWAASWHQRPAASLPNSPAVLERLSMLPPKAWAKVRDRAVAAWVLCDDGRLYHVVVAEKALEAWLEKLTQRLKSGRGNAKRWGIAYDAAPVQAAIDDTIARLKTISPNSPRIPRAEGQRPHRDSPSDPPAIPQGSQGIGIGIGIGIEDTEAKASAPERGVEDFDGRAWDCAVGLLTMDQTVSDRSARSFFGKLLSTHGLQARDLLPALMGAAVNGTRDAKAYLTKAASHIAKRRASGRQQDVDWC